MTTLQHPVLGIDIGGTNMRFALVDGALHLRAYEQLSTQAVFAHGAQPTQKLAQQIRAYCARHLQGEAPAAVSIGFPSTINRARTVVLQTPNIEGIPDNYAVVQELGGELGLPVYINRDVNNLLLFDLEDLGLTDCGCVTAIYFGTGLGNAVMLGQKLLLGLPRRGGRAGPPARIRQPACVQMRQPQLPGDGCLGPCAGGHPGRTLPADAHSPAVCPAHGHRGDAGFSWWAWPRWWRMEINLFDPDCMVLGGGLLTDGRLPAANSWKRWCTAMRASPTRSGTCGCAIRAQTSKMALWARPSMPASAWRTRSIYNMRGPAP